MNKYIFDVDGTLTPSRQKIDKEFAIWFELFCIANDVYLVTGSDYAKIKEQLGDYLLGLPVFVYTCSGNEKWAKGECVKSKTWTPPGQLYEILQGWLAASKFPARFGNHLEHRPGMLNFSVVGRNATLAERKMYAEWDLINRERESIAFQINSSFEDITAVVGGEISVDISPTGWDKSQILEDFDKDDILHFFGDKMNPGGNDWSLAQSIELQKGKSYSVKNWQDTWDKLKSLKGAKIVK